jgi:VIT1/CCC1 family predicted Fe2+/Mn2+ transporter
VAVKGAESSLVPLAPPWTGSGQALSPIDHVSGVMFGLIMALTFTGTLSVATADHAEVRDMLIGALGCNIAWGLVDATMYILATLAERGRNLTILHEVRNQSDAGRAHDLILDALPPVVASTMQPADVEAIRTRLARLDPPARVGITLADVRTAVGVFLLVFLATFPVALPFVFVQGAHRALRVSNGVALVMLFAGGYVLGRHAGRHPWLTGLFTLAIGVVLVWATIALGG